MQQSKKQIAFVVGVTLPNGKIKTINVKASNQEVAESRAKKRTGATKAAVLRTLA